MARILWMSDTPRRVSGFGLVTGEVCKRLAGLGHEILILGWWSCEATTYLGLDVKPCPVSPRAAASAIMRYAAEFRPHYLVTLGDIPWLSYVAADDVRKVLSRSGIRWCFYYPVDGTLPDGSLPRDWARVLSKADLAVTMSEFGVAASALCGINATLIPHGCDTELFRPPHNKEDSKRRFGYEGRFVVLSDVRNHRRKLIPRALDIIRRLQVPGSRLVYHLHTAAEAQEDAESYRYDVRADIELLGLSFATGVQQSADVAALSMCDLARLYSAADVHLLTSFGEGFGLPTLQAASSGVVPIAAANSASTELVGSHGFAVPCDSWTTDEFGIVRKFIDRRQAASVLQVLYDDPELLNARSAAARRFALSFSWDNAVAQWDTLLRGDEQKRPRRRLSDYGKRAQSSGSSSAYFLPPSGPGSSKALTPRPTGHDPSILPIPRISVPTRLELRQDDTFAAANPIILAEASCARQLRTLERLFPGSIVIAVARPNLPTHQDLQKFIARFTLVVDPHGRLPRLDRVCALRGVNFLGKSPLWPPVASRTLLRRARLLLTDYALSEHRASVAKQRAGDAIEAPATAYLRSDVSDGIRSSHAHPE